MHISGNCTQQQQAMCKIDPIGSTRPQIAAALQDSESEPPTLQLNGIA